MLRALRPAVTVGFFLHIPFPPVELFAYLPWRSSVLDGLLGADVLAFQTRQSVANFRDAALRYSDAQAAGDDLEIDGRRVRLQWAPISIDSGAFESAAARPAVVENAARLRQQIDPARRLLLGVDRLDYTKGIDHRLRAVQTFHERYPLEAENTVLLQVAVPSREELIQYAQQRERVEQLVGQINGEFGKPGYTPVVYMYRHLGFEDLVAAYLAADVMLVTPLADGMNLVAKEYIASRTADEGLLVLSEFAGAAAELEEAIQINPLNLDEFADTLLYAVKISKQDAASRMRCLRETVRDNDVYQWSRNCLEALE
jgi:trehalose-6-phosphate synthase